MPLQQSPPYGAAMVLHGPRCLQVCFYDNTEGTSTEGTKTEGPKTGGANNQPTLIGFGLLLKRKFFGLIEFTTLMRGPVWLAHAAGDTDAAQRLRTQALAALASGFSRPRLKFLAVMPEAPTSDALEASMRTAGLKQVMTGFSTAWVDLRLSEDVLRQTLTPKWRNQLRSSEKAGLDVHIGGKKYKHYSWLLTKEDTQQNSRGYKALPHTLIPLFENAGGRLLCVSVRSRTQKGGTPLSAALFLIHGRSSTYHIGWTSEEGRALNSQNLVMWQAMLALKAAGVDHLDLGGMNTDTMAGITRFKLGLGWPPLLLAGSYM